MANFVTDNCAASGAVSTLNTTLAAANSDRYVYAFVYAESGVTLASLTYGSQTLTPISGAGLAGFNSVIQVYGLVAPNTGTQTVTANFSGNSSRCLLYVAAWDGVDQTTPVGTPSTVYTDGPSSQLSAASAAGQAIVDFCVVATDGITVGSGTQTVREIRDNWLSTARSFGSSSTTATGSNTALSWTPNSSTDCFHIAIPLNSAVGPSIAAIYRYYQGLRNG